MAQWIARRTSNPKVAGSSPAGGVFLDLSTSFPSMSFTVFVVYYHTVIPLWIYRIPSELRSQAGLGLPSTVVGDHTGIAGAVCFFVLPGFYSTDKKVFFTVAKMENPGFDPGASSLLTTHSTN